MGWKTRSALFAIAIALALLFRPASTHVRAAMLLTSFTNSSAPMMDETLEDIDGPHGKIYVRTYRPRDKWDAPGLVLSHGVHRLGIEEPRLVRFARSLAASGVTVVTPEIAELTDYHVDPKSIDTIGTTAKMLHARTRASVGVMRMSFAGGLSLLATADPRYAPDIAFAVAIGAHDDLARVSRFFATNQIPRPDGTTLAMHAHDYGPLVLVYSHIEDFFPADDVATARDA